MASNFTKSALEVASDNVKNLPDYAALKQLAAALWQQNNSYHGAAVMIGAGFSRCGAASSDIEKKLPLWNDLSKILAEALGENKNTDPLRLAEEYCAYFGRQALQDLVIREINDSSWVPGDLYESLLKLPWSDVLTTNWDTLLERASLKISQPVYGLVSRQEELSSSRAPRIVKLHGTVSITEKLIFTQEDYRKYPRDHAAFVNFGRQVFIENELCLVGFSGDDPNFLQWAGWVRDQLSSSSRRIYLVGALNLTAAKRKYFESINVAPIDLASLVIDYDDQNLKHEIATKIFLKTLDILKPKQVWDWVPTLLSQSMITEEHFNKRKNPINAVAALERQLPMLEADRKSYPGWLVCPISLRWKLESQINDPFPTAKIISEMTPDCRAKLLYEISWRYSVTYQVIPSWLAQELFTVCNPSNPCILTKKQQMEMSLILLRNTRWFNDAASKVIEEETLTILQVNSEYWLECSNELAMHQASVARDNFDFSELENLADKIKVTEPTWGLKKASLLAELGRFDESNKLISDAYRELLSQYRSERNSIYVLSRLAWAHWLLRGVEIQNNYYSEPYPSLYESFKSSPFEIIDHIKEQISKALDRQKKQKGIQPSFMPGQYKNNSDTVTLNNEIHPLMLLNGISDATGIPLRWDNVNFLVEPASSITELDEIDSLHCFALAIRAAKIDTSNIIGKVFSRIRIANLSQDDADYIFNYCFKAINYWSDKLSGARGPSQSHTIDRLRVFIEVLARVSVRATEEQATSLFNFAIELGKKKYFQHLWLCTPLKHLLEYSLESIPESSHQKLLLNALSFPLLLETEITIHNEWPNPVIKCSGSRIDNPTLDRRIDEVIEAIGPCSFQSAPALLRLLPLLENNFLVDSERKKISLKIWGSNPNYTIIPETGLLNYTLLDLPAENPSAVKATIRKYLFEAEGNSIFESLLLTNLINTSKKKAACEFPDESQAESYFDRLVSWRPRLSENDFFGITEKDERRKAELVGAALSRSVVPALPTKLLNEDSFAKIYKLHGEVESAELVLAFTYFALNNACFSDRVEKIIRQGLQANTPNKVAYSSYALLKWREVGGESPAVKKLTSRLIYLIGSHRTVGLPALLWTISQMYVNKFLSEEDNNSLIELLPFIFDGAQYSSVMDDSQEAVSVSLIRAGCIMVVKLILLNYQGDGTGELLRVMDDARRDSLPEVRFATIK